MCMSFRVPGYLRRPALEPRVSCAAMLPQQQECAGWWRPRGGRGAFNGHREAGEPVAPITTIVDTGYFSFRPPHPRKERSKGKREKRGKKCEENLDKAITSCRWERERDAVKTQSMLQDSGRKRCGLATLLIAQNSSEG